MNPIDPSLPGPSSRAASPVSGPTPGPAASTAAAPETPITLFRRPGQGPDAPPVDATRRERLLRHAQRHAARREALAALLRSGALADAAQVDPLLKRDVHKLMAFVFSDGPAQPTESR